MTLRWLKDNGQWTGEQITILKKNPLIMIPLNIHPLDYFNSTASILRPRKKSKVEQFSSITIEYIASQDTIIWKSKRILMDSGWTGTLNLASLIVGS
jgi:hypothetical protein